MNNPSSKNGFYELIDHTADFGLRIFGTDASDLFKNAAVAMTDLIVDADLLQSTHTCSLRISGDDWADLMVNWLRELLYLWTVKEKLVHSVAIESIRENEIVATVRYAFFAPRRHVLKNEIKAVTYHQIQVVDTGNGWQAQVIFDV